jgi:serine protease Do
VCFISQQRQLVLALEERMTTKTRKHLVKFSAAVAFVAVVAAVACGASPANSKNNSEKEQTKSTAPLNPTTYDPQLSLAPLVEKVSAAVVNVRTKSKPRMPSNMMPFGPDIFEWFFGQQQRRSPQPDMGPEQRSLGSGFIIDKSGLVVTNNHVVSGADEIEVQLSDEQLFSAEVVGTDERTDMALLRLKSIKNKKNLPVVSFGDSDALRVGDHVVAIGNPFGLDHTVTSGIVSAKERVIGAGPYDAFIQTDASINPGNSGGPLFNLKGEVIGINTAINPQGQGIGFAIPSNLASDIIKSLGAGGEVVRGWLGIAFQPMTEELAKAFGLSGKKGVVVANVTPDSPAQKGGMKSGDIVLSVDGKPLGDSKTLPHMVAKIKPGTVAPFTVFRDGKEITLKIEIGKMPGDEEKSPTSSSSTKGETDLGLTVDNLDDRMRNRLGADAGVAGVVVTEVATDSPAGDVIQQGDIILEMNRKPTKTPAEFKAEAKKIKSGETVILRVFRQGSWLWITFPG